MEIERRAIKLELKIWINKNLKYWKNKSYWIIIIKFRKINLRKKIIRKRL